MSLPFPASRLDETLDKDRTKSVSGKNNCSRKCITQAAHTDGALHESKFLVLMTQFLRSIKSNKSLKIIKNTEPG